jgi:hypothetical protein
MNVQAAEVKRARLTQKFIVEASGGAASMFGADGQSETRPSTCATAARPGPIASNDFPCLPQAYSGTTAGPRTQYRGSSASQPSRQALRPEHARLSILGAGGLHFTNRMAALHNVDSKRGCSTGVVQGRRPSPRRGNTGHGGRERAVSCCVFIGSVGQVQPRGPRKDACQSPRASSLADSSQEDGAPEGWMRALPYVSGGAAPCPDAQEPGSSPGPLPKHFTACLSLPRCHPRLLRLPEGRGDLGCAARHAGMAARGLTLRSRLGCSHQTCQSVSSSTHVEPLRHFEFAKRVRTTFGVSQLTAAAQSRLKWPQCSIPHVHRPLKDNSHWCRAAERQCPNDPWVGDALEIGYRFARVRA